MRPIREWVAVAAIFLVIGVWTASTQRPITFNQGEGWDGMDYCAMARCFAKGERPAAGAPFINRIVAPYLAALVNPTDVIAGFRTLNIGLTLLTVVLFVIWLRLYLSDWRVRVLLVLLYCITFFNPLRDTFYYPPTTDAISHVGVFAGMLLLHRLRTAGVAVAVAAMTAFAILGAATREFLLIFPVALLLRDNPIEIDWKIPWWIRVVKWPSPWLLIPIVLGTATLVAIRLWVITVPNWYHFRSHIVGMIFNKSLVPYFHGWCIAFGPILALLLWKARDSALFLWARQWMLAIFLAIALLGWIAGTDTERFLAWTSPITFVLLGRVIEQNRRWLRSPVLIGLLIAAQALSQRIFWPLPDYPPAIESKYFVLLTMWGTKIDVLNLYSWHARQGLALISLAEYLAVMIGVVIWLRFSESRQNSQGADFQPAAKYMQNITFSTSHQRWD